MRHSHLLAAAILFQAAALANDCRFTLADQSNWSANTGFYLDLEDSPVGSATYCQMQNLSIDVGSADGTEWQFIGWNPAWVTGHNYTAQVIITPTYFELYLDGQLLGHVAGGFAGIPTQGLMGGSPPYGDTGASDYVVTETAITAQDGSNPAQTVSFPANQRPVPLMLLAPGSTPEYFPFSYPAADTLTITVAFNLTAVAPNPASYAPYVDAYGQSIYSTYSGKIQTDADLQSAAAYEQTQLAAWGVPTGYDPYGGVLNAPWQDTASGFYHVVKHNSVWWLISPDGNPCFYIGLDNGPLTTGNNTPTTSREWEFAAMPPQTPTYSPAWSVGDWGNTEIGSVSFDTSNMIKKYGADSWQITATNLTVQRMQAWGFSGFGKWSNATANLPILPVLWANNVPSLVSHPDVFDPQIQSQLNSALQQQVQPSVNDPTIVGWSFQNEIDGIIMPQEVQQILGMAASVPCKQALINDALNVIYGEDVATMAASWGVTASTVAELYNSNPSPPAGDIETMREYYEEQFYAFLYQTFKTLDPNHLYLGFWIVPGWWVNATDWQLLAAHVDVIGYDRYSPVFEDSLLEGLAKATGMPILLGEYSFPPHYDLQRGYEVYQAANAPDDATAGAMYTTNLQSAARNPWCVGVAWFEYRDEPVSGRGFLGETDTDIVEGEDYAFGMVDVADRPKYDLVNAVRTANLAAAQERLTFGPPNLNPGGTVSNASFSTNPVAPGSLVSIFGTGLSGSIQVAAGVPLPDQLGMTSLTLGGVPMPLIHAFPLQVDAQVPWELAGQTQAALTIVTDDLAGNTVSVPLAPYSPGIYTANGTGSGQGAILINGTTNLASPTGQPAQRGSDYINIFATGLGPVSNQPATGTPAPSDSLARTTSTVTVMIGNVPANVSFAGLAPGFVGLYQVNVQVPANAPTGDAVPVVLSVGGVVSNQVTIAVE